MWVITWWSLPSPKSSGWVTRSWGCSRITGITRSSSSTSLCLCVCGGLNLQEKCVIFFSLDPLSRHITICHNMADLMKVPEPKVLHCSIEKAAFLVLCCCFHYADHWKWYRIAGNFSMAREPSEETFAVVIFAFQCQESTPTNKICMWNTGVWELGPVLIFALSALPSKKISRYTVYNLCNVQHL